MEMKLDDHVLRLAKRAPSAGKRVAVYSSVVREGRARAGLAALRPASTGGIPVRVANIPVPGAALSVRFVASRESRPAPNQPRPVDLTKKEPRGLLAGVSRQDIETLQRMEADLLKWIGAKPENAARFFADPLGSLDSAGVKVTRQLRLRILDLRKRTALLRSKLPAVRIRSIKAGA